MTQLSRTLFALSSLFALFAARAHAQDVPAAIAHVQLYGWAGFGGNFTGDELAKNGDVEAGFDVEVKPFFGLHPAAEVRGLLPVLDHTVITEKNLLGGIRLGRHVRNYVPYGDVLFGRGELHYLNGGQLTPDGSFIVLSNTSNVLSFGGGNDWFFTNHLAIKGDFQFQRYATPVTTSGALYSKVFTVGIVYRIGSGGLR